jgi:L-ascorbate metabolism protein UlaG (beta-lactamase superfamily)
MTRRRSLLAAIAALPLAGFYFSMFTRNTMAQAVLTGDAIATAQGDITIHPVSHASLLLGWQDQVIYVDPVGGVPAYEGLPAATAILITHGHPDHFDVPTLEAIAGDTVPLLVSPEVFGKLPEGLKARATSIENGASGELAGVAVAAIPAYNTTADRAKYHPKGAGNGYVLSFGDKKVYVAGDTEDTEEMRALSGIEAAFLPMNLPYTMTVEQAADAVKAFKPAIVYPYHYQGSDTAKFKELVGDAAEVRLVDWYAKS